MRMFSRVSGALPFSLILALVFGQITSPVMARPYALNTSQARRVAGPIDQVLQAQKNKDIKLLMQQFHPDVRLLWSNGKLFKNTLEVQNAYQRSFLAYSNYEGSWAPEYVNIENDTAWTTGETSWGFRVIETGQVLHMTSRSTYILKKHAGRWKIVYEHSSHRRSD